MIAKSFGWDKADSYEEAIQNGRHSIEVEVI